MTIFNVGDRVRVNHGNWSNFPKGTEATIIRIADTGEVIVDPDYPASCKESWWGVPAHGNFDLVERGSVSAQVAELEAKLAAALDMQKAAASKAANESALRHEAERRLRDLQRHEPPFSQSQAREIAAQVESVLNGRTSIPEGARAYRFAVTDPWGYAARSEGFSAAMPGYRTVTVSW